MTEAQGYDREAAEREATVYETEAAARRRAFVREQLDPSRGDDVASIGCGPGFEPAELAEELGDGGDGSVVGVDASPAMLDLARERCRNRHRVSLVRGSADALPLPTDGFDGAVAVQVLRYVPDPGSALAELRRVLRPDGRAVVLETDWDTLVCRADDDERSQRVIDAWASQCPHPRLGSRLEPLCTDAGLDVVRVEPFTIVQRSLRDTFFGRNLPFVVEHVAAHDDLGPDVASAWEADVRARDERGETFVSMTQYAYVLEPANR